VCYHFEQQLIIKLIVRNKKTAGLIDNLYASYLTSKLLIEKNNRILQLSDLKLCIQASNTWHYNFQSLFSIEAYHIFQILDVNGCDTKKNCGKSFVHF
jgi:hypothetical protein